jgi:hypothetical protein
VSEETTEIGKVRVVGIDMTIEDCVRIVWKMTVASVIVAAPIWLIVYLIATEL